MITDDRLSAALELSRRAGFLGSAPVVDHIRHSRDFADHIPPDSRVADLGAGGGVPGLVIAADRPDLVILLVESSRRRSDHLVRLIERLELGGRVTVEDRPAEEIGRDPALRGHFDLVVARGFGPPAVTGECAAPLLRSGGRLLVAEPPNPTPARWSRVDASLLPLRLTTVHAGESSHIAELELTQRCPDRFPRRVGTPARQPLFR